MKSLAMRPGNGLCAVWILYPSPHHGTISSPADSWFLLSGELYLQKGRFESWWLESYLPKGELKMRKISSRALWIAAIFLCIAIAAFAQSTNSADLRGTVSDTSGAVMPGVKV